MGIVVEYQEDSANEDARQVSVSGNLEATGTVVPRARPEKRQEAVGGNSRKGRRIRQPEGSILIQFFHKILGWPSGVCALSLPPESWSSEASG